MKTAVVFYSFSGNTRSLAQFIAASLPEGAAELVELKLVNEEKSFLGQCRDAVMKKIPELLGAAFNPEKFDLILFASPVWAFTFAPALRSQLEKIRSLSGKKTGVLLTCGSGAGTKKALQELENVVKQKGAELVFSAFVQGHQCKNESYLKERLKPLIEACKV